MEAELKTPTQPRAQRSSASIASIRGVDERCQRQAQQHLDSLTKPLGSLGQLEAVAAQYVAWREEAAPADRRQGGVCLCRRSWHHRRRASAPIRGKSRTQMVRNFLNGGAAINVLARQTNSDIVVVDVGVDADFEGVPGLLHRKVRRGTRNFAREAAMTRNRAECRAPGRHRSGDRSRARKAAL